MISTIKVPHSELICFAVSEFVLALRNGPSTLARASLVYIIIEINEV